MNDLQSVSRIKGQRAESELLLRALLMREKRKRTLAELLLQKTFLTLLRDVSLRLLRLLDLSLQSLKEAQMTNSFYTPRCRNLTDLESLHFSITQIQFLAYDPMSNDIYQIKLD
jgi:hypothetical protein